MNIRNIICGAILASTVVLGSPARAADIVIGVGPWATINATAHVLQQVIEQYFGLTVALQYGNNPTLFAGMDRGTIQIDPEVWLPDQGNLQHLYVDKKKTVVMDKHAVIGFQGICVDKAHAEKYHISTVFDLTNPKIATVFDVSGNGRGDMWIGVPGWESTNIERIRAKSYGYDQTMNLNQSDETVAYAALGNAIRTGKPWLGFCDSPHYIFAEFKNDIVVLKEPPYDESKWHVKQPSEDPSWLQDSSAPTAWPPVHLNLDYSKSLEKTHPELLPLVRNFALNTDVVSGFAYALVVQKQDPTAFAKDWVTKNKHLVMNWLSK